MQTPIRLMSTQVIFNPNKGYQCLVAARKLDPGHRFWHFTEYDLQDFPSMYTIQISENKHLNDEGRIRYMNHSCNPNAIIDAELMCAIVIRPIEKGEEITFFYPSTEWDMSVPFSCKCEYENCVKVIQGAKYLTEEEFNQYFMNKHIMRLRANQTEPQIEEFAKLPNNDDRFTI